MVEIYNRQTLTRDSGSQSPTYTMAVKITYLLANIIGKMISYQLLFGESMAVYNQLGIPAVPYCSFNGTDIRGNFHQKKQALIFLSHKYQCQKNDLPITSPGNLDHAWPFCVFLYDCVQPCLPVITDDQKRFAFQDRNNQMHF